MYKPIEGEWGFLPNICHIDPQMPLLCAASGVYTSGSMATTNHVFGIWQMQVLDVECARSYPFCRDNLYYTCEMEVRFDTMTYGIALIPSKHLVGLALKNLYF